MHPHVRDLYKRIIFVGRDYPKGLSYVREKAKAWFNQNKNITDEIELKRKIAEGRHMVREMTAVISLKKYRHLKNKYYENANIKEADSQFLSKEQETNTK